MQVVPSCGQFCDYANSATWWQVAFFLTQVKESIPWVRFASGNVFTIFDNIGQFWQPRQIRRFLTILRIEKIVLESCDIWDTDYNSENWKPEFMTIIFTWQLIVRLDSIRNSCDVFYVYSILPWNDIHFFLARGVLSKGMIKLWQESLKERHSIQFFTPMSTFSTSHTRKWSWLYSNVGLGSSLRGEPGLTTFRSPGCL